MNNSAYRKLIEQSKSTVDGDSNWLITLADVMTLLMVFFVMFLIAKQSESDRKSPEGTSAAVKQAGNNHVIPHGNVEDNIRDTIAVSIKELGMEKDVAVSLVNKDIVITMTEGITFKPGKSEILDKSGPIMEKIAESIRKNLSYTVEIDGH